MHASCWWNQLFWSYRGIPVLEGVEHWFAPEFIQFCYAFLFLSKHRDLWLLWQNRFPCSFTSWNSCLLLSWSSLFNGYTLIQYIIVSNWALFRVLNWWLRAWVWWFTGCEASASLCHVQSIMGLFHIFYLFVKILSGFTLFVFQIIIESHNALFVIFF